MAGVWRVFDRCKASVPTTWRQQWPRGAAVPTTWRQQWPRGASVPTTWRQQRPPWCISTDHVAAAVATLVHQYRPRGGSSGHVVHQYRPCGGSSGHVVHQYRPAAISAEWRPILTRQKKHGRDMKDKTPFLNAKINMDTEKTALVG